MQPLVQEIVILSYGLQIMFALETKSRYLETQAWSSLHKCRFTSRNSVGEAGVVILLVKRDVFCCGR